MVDRKATGVRSKDKSGMHTKSEDMRSPYSFHLVFREKFRHIVTTY